MTKGFSSQGVLWLEAEVWPHPPDLPCPLSKAPPHAHLCASGCYSIHGADCIYLPRGCFMKESLPWVSEWLGGMMGQP